MANFIAIAIGGLRIVLKSLEGTGGFGNQWKNQSHSDSSITENGLNTEKSPGDLWSLAVTQTPVKDHHLSLVWKTPKEGNDNRLVDLEIRGRTAIQTAVKHHQIMLALKNLRVWNNNKRAKKDRLL